MSYDAINPSHYRGGRKFEPIEVIEDWGLGYHLGDSLKYIARHGRKPGEDPVEGLSKAIWYLERLQDKYTEKVRDQDQDEQEFQALGDIPNSVLFGADDDILRSTVPQENWGKDLTKFSDDSEIIYQSYEGGYVFGHQKNGDVRILGLHGAPLTTFDGDNAPSEHEPPLHDC